MRWNTWLSSSRTKTSHCTLCWISSVLMEGCYSSLRVIIFQINVSSWLVARVAIVAIFPNYSETHVLFGGFAFVTKQNWENHFFWKKKFCNFSSKTLELSQVFAHLSIWACKCISIWVSLFAGFTIAASCARAAPGSPEEKQAFSKIAKFKLQAFPQRTNPLLNPY